MLTSVHTCTFLLLYILSAHFRMRSAFSLNYSHFYIFTTYLSTGTVRHRIDRNHGNSVHLPVNNNVNNVALLVRRQLRVSVCIHVLCAMTKFNLIEEVN